MLDVLISFRTAYLDVTGDAETRIVTSQKAIAIKYAKGFLFFDIISSVPFDLILLMLSCDSVNGANRLLRSPKALKIIRLVRLLRLLRISRLQVFLRKVNDVLQINPGLLRLLRFIFLVCLAFHCKPPTPRRASSALLIVTSYYWHMVSRAHVYLTVVLGR